MLAWVARCFWEDQAESLGIVNSIAIDAKLDFIRMSNSSYTSMFLTNPYSRRSNPNQSDYLILFFGNTPFSTCHLVC